jgi:class 3 adenylate cyclase
MTLLFAATYPERTAAAIGYGCGVSFVQTDDYPWAHSRERWGDRVYDLGLEIRVGLHTGECELMNGKVGGIAVHIGARVAKQAEPGEVLVSSTVRDLVAGSGLRFRERGSAELKGVPGEWRLYAVEL